MSKQLRRASKRVLVRGMLADCKLDASPHPNDVLEVTLLKLEVNTLRAQLAEAQQVQSSTAAMMVLGDLELTDLKESFSQILSLSEKREMTEALIDFERKLRACMGIEEQLILPSSQMTCLMYKESQGCGEATPLSSATPAESQGFSDFTTAASLNKQCLVTVSRMSEPSSPQPRTVDETSGRRLSATNIGGGVGHATPFSTQQKKTEHSHSPHKASVQNLFSPGGKSSSDREQGDSGSVHLRDDEANIIQQPVSEKKRVIHPERLELPFSIDEGAITVTESRFCTAEQIQYATKALKNALQFNSKLHKVSSSVIGAMRQNYGGNWFCNIRSRQDQMGVRFHGRKEGIFMSFSHGSTTYRVQINQL